MMADSDVRVTLSKQEWDFIAALRDIPEGQLKTLLGELLHRLVEFVREPSCPEVQADGAPCATPTADCEQCVRVKGVLELLRRDLQKQ
jgi:hypothetical protein